MNGVLKFRMPDGEWRDVVAIRGEKGDKGDKGDKGQDGTVSFNDLTDEQKKMLKGDKGAKGDAYVLTDKDVADIVDKVYNKCVNAGSIKY